MAKMPTVMIDGVLYVPATMLFDFSAIGQVLLEGYWGKDTSADRVKRLKNAVFVEVTDERISDDPPTLAEVLDAIALKLAQA